MNGARGYHVIYREQEVNFCPGCGRTQWYVGRHTAECAFCGTTLELERNYGRGCSTPRKVEGLMYAAS